MEITIDDKKINYEVEGKGKPIVLLPGWLCGLETLKPLANYLKYNFKVYSIDVIGFGKSDKLDKAMSCDDYGDFLKKVIDKLKIKNPILLGHSHGGRMIINYLGRELGDAYKVILIDSAGLKSKHKLKYYYRVFKYKIFKGVLKICPNTEMFNNMRKRYVESKGSSDYKNSDEFQKKSMIMVLNEDEGHYLKNIKAKTLIIWGEKDTATPLSMGEIMHKEIKNSELFVIKDGSHYSYLDDLQGTYRKLEEFLVEDVA